MTRSTPTLSTYGARDDLAVAGEHDDLETHRLQPATRHSAASGRSVSATASAPRTRPPAATRSGVRPFSASACASDAVTASSPLVRARRTALPQELARSDEDDLTVEHCRYALAGRCASNPVDSVVGESRVPRPSRRPPEPPGARSSSPPTRRSRTSSSDVTPSAGTTSVHDISPFVSVPGLVEDDRRRACARSPASRHP